MHSVNFWVRKALLARIFNIVCPINIYIFTYILYDIYHKTIHFDSTIYTFKNYTVKICKWEILSYLAYFFSIINIKHRNNIFCWNYVHASSRCNLHRYIGIYHWISKKSNHLQRALKYAGKLKHSFGPLLTGWLLRKHIFCFSLHHLWYAK